MGIHVKFPARTGQFQGEVNMKEWLQNKINKIDFCAGYSPAYIFIAMILTIGVVMIMYTLFNDFVTSVFYNMAISNGGDEELFGLMVDYWETYFIIAFVLSMVLWAIVNAMRDEGW